MGRPKLPPGERRDVPTTVMMTEIERAQLENLAASHGLSVSEFVRRRVRSAPLPKAAGDRVLDAKLATALLRLGVNLNQIARHMNAGRHAPPDLPALIDTIKLHVNRLTDDPRRDRQGTVL
jgi:hypothetical protein